MILYGSGAGRPRAVFFLKRSSLNKKILLFWFVLVFLFCAFQQNAQKEVAGLGRKNRSEIELELLRLHNQKRESVGLRSLEMNESLCNYAQRHAEFMAESGSLHHSSMSALQKFSGRGSVAENIAWGQSDPKSVVSDWMWSPGHRRNILGSAYKKVGFGMKEDSKGRNYWCVVFSN